MGTLFVDKLDPQSGTSLEIGSSGDTITIPSGATIANSGTATGFGGDNTPAFFAYLSANQTVAHNSTSRINCNTEVVDTDSAYDNSSNYRFTVPSGKAGKYFFNGQVAFSATVTDNHVGFAKNGSTTVVGGSYDTFFEAKGANASTVNTSAIIDLAAGDYVEMFTFNTNGSVPTTSTGRTRFFGYRLIGA